MKKILTIALIGAFALGAVCCSGGGEDDNRPEYTVTFEADGGTPAPAAKRVKEGDTVPAPPAVTREGYAFLFWSLNGTNAYDFTTPVTGNITLTAHWQSEATVEYWQVEWRLDGGAWPSGDNHATRVVRGGTLAEPAAPTKTGSTFDGWYREAALTNKISFPYDVSAVTGNITLYAKWSAPAPGAELSLNIGEDYPIPNGHVLTFSNLASTGEVNVYKPIVVATNQSSWDAVSNQTWCTVVKEARQFTIKVSANTASAERKATVTVSAGSAASIVIQIEQGGAVWEEDSNLRKAAYCLAYVYEVTEKRKQGQNISSISGICNVEYNPNMTLNYISFSSYSAIVPYSYNIPLVMSSASSSNVTAATSARGAILGGTYDYAGDPAKIFAYMGAYSVQLFFSVNELGGKSTLEKMQMAANNNAITADILSNMRYPTNSYKMLVFGKNKEGVLMGKYLGYTVDGKNFSYLTLDPDDPKFGLVSAISIPN